MTGSLIHGDHVSCSRVGGAMRSESARLRRHAQSLADALNDLPASGAPDAGAAGPATGAMAAMEAMGAMGAMGAIGAAARVAGTLQALNATADDLDQAGAALQRYATELAESHELGRRAELRAEGAGLLIDGTRVTEPWGPASAQEAERRLALVPGVQSRVDLATAHVGRARGRLHREMTRLTARFSADSREARLAVQAPLPSRRGRPT